jgi:uncharacterized OB-fold protein
MSASSEESKDVKLITTPVRCEYQYTPGTATQKFLRGFERGKIMGQACDNCGKVYVPPRGACAKCGSPTSKEVECANKGTVVTMTIVRVPSQNIQVELPYVAANVLLDGADITFTALIQECNFEDVRVGMRVEGVWKPEAEWEPSMTNLKYFRPIDEPDVPFEQFKEIS